MKKLITTITSLVIGVSIASTAFASNESMMHSGDLNAAKLSKYEIVEILSANPLDLPSNVYDIAPDWSNDNPGKITDETLKITLNRLNALRRIAGVPALTLATELTKNAQYGACISAANGFQSHTPEMPSGISENFYNKGYTANLSSNLYAGRNLTNAIDGFMDDSDAKNIVRLGHRRWQLSPYMGKIGFGFAESNTLYKRYVDEWVFDKSGEGCDYNFIAWPASGNFPSDTAGFTVNSAWSITLNPDKYQTPDIDSVTVTLVRAEDGKTWTFSGTNYEAAGTGTYFGIDTSGCSVPNVIVFRPNGINVYDGIYTVTLTGLKNKDCSDVENFTYQVDFFNTNDFIPIDVEANVGTGCNAKTGM